MIFYLSIQVNLTLERQIAILLNWQSQKISKDQILSSSTLLIKVQHAFAFFGIWSSFVGVFMVVLF